MKKFRRDVRLPEKLSELIRVAAKDMEKALLADEYIIDMGNWHSWRAFLDTDGKPVHKCAVCYAGTVMAGTLGADKEEEFDPHVFGTYNQPRLSALDSLRHFDLYGPVVSVAGLSEDEAQKLCEDWFEAEVRNEMVDYDTYFDHEAGKEVDNFDQFFASQMKLADWLEQRGL